MKTYTEKMKRYLKEHPFDSKERDVDGVLEYLTSCYLEENPVSSREIVAIEEEMAPYYENVSFEESEKRFRLVYALCGKYEEAGFRAGLQVGLRLREEIAEL